MDSVSLGVVRDGGGGAAEEELENQSIGSRSWRATSRHPPWTGPKPKETQRVAWGSPSSVKTIQSTRVNRFEEYSWPEWRMNTAGAVSLQGDRRNCGSEDEGEGISTGKARRLVGIMQRRNANIP